MGSSIKLTRYTLENMEEAIPHIYQMAVELRKAHELTAVSFSVTNNLLASHNGCFYTATLNDQLVGYACFSFGTQNPNIRRLYYFAVPSKLQGMGYGSRALKAIIDNELPALNGSLTVACESAQAGFYEKQGFTNAGESEEFSAATENGRSYFSPTNEPDIVLTYSKNPDLSPSSIISEEVAYIAIDLGELAPHLPFLEKNFNIDLTSDLPAAINLNKGSF